MDRYEAIVGAIANLKEALGKAGFHLEVGIGRRGSGQLQQAEEPKDDEDKDLQTAIMSGIREVIKSKIRILQRSSDSTTWPMTKLYQDRQERGELERLLPIMMAAPELLDAAKAVTLDYYSNDLDEVDQSHISRLGKAIAKAEGESD